MYGNFTEEARKVLVNAKKEMYELKHPYVGSEHLLLAILKGDNSVSQKLKESGLDYAKFKEEIIAIVGMGSEANHYFLRTPLLKRILENAIMDSKENNNGEVTIEHLFSSLLEEGEGVAIRIMLGMQLDLDQLYSDFIYRFTSPKKHKKNKKLLLEELGIDLTLKAQNGELDPVIGRDDELKRVLEVLSRRTKNNPILIGEAGVGKTAIVEELSRLIAVGEVPMQLKNKRIISLDMATAVAGTKYRGEFEERMRKILKEIEDNDDIILFIDEIHTLVGAGGAEGAIDASNIFKPALARNKLRCIGATTTSEYKKYIEKDGALERRFQKIMVDTPSREVVKDILMKLKGIYEKYHFVQIGEEMIDLIIDLSGKYIYDRNEPDRSIDILDEVCAKVSLKENKDIKKYNQLKKKVEELILQKNNAVIHHDFETASKLKETENQYLDEMNHLELKLYQKNRKPVTKEDIADVVHLKTKIPVYEILEDNQKTIQALERELKNKIVGQDHALEELLAIAKKIKLGFYEHQCYSMMFMGPSGVGKTQLATLFGDCMVGHQNVIRLDMSEYTEAHSVSKIIGAPPGYVGYDDNRNVLEEIRNKPYSVLILDEIEKAHPNIIHLFFQILEEGKIKDASGKMVRFDHVIILMTSNIGFTDIHVGFHEATNDTVLSKLKENFSVAFVNRMDNVIVFHTLTKDNIMEVIHTKIKNLKEKYHKRKISVQIKPSVLEEICTLSNYSEYGARKIDKIIKDKIENQIIDAVIMGNQTVEVRAIAKEKVR